MVAAEAVISNAWFFLPSLHFTSIQIMSNISCFLAPSAFSIPTAMPTPLLSLRLSMTSSYQSCGLFFPSVPSLFPSTRVKMTSCLTSLWIPQTALTSSQSGPSADQTSAVCVLTRRATLFGCPSIFLVKLRGIISRLCFKSLVSLPFTRNGSRSHVLRCYFYLF